MDSPYTINLLAAGVSLDANDSALEDIVESTLQYLTPLHTGVGMLWWFGLSACNQPRPLSLDLNCVSSVSKHHGTAPPVPNSVLGV